MAVFGLFISSWQLIWKFLKWKKRSVWYCAGLSWWFAALSLFVSVYFVLKLDLQNFSKFVLPSDGICEWMLEKGNLLASILNFWSPLWSRVEGWAQPFHLRHRLVSTLHNLDYCFAVFTLWKRMQYSSNAAQEWFPLFFSPLQNICEQMQADQMQKFALLAQNYFFLQVMF